MKTTSIKPINIKVDVTITLDLSPSMKKLLEKVGA